MMKLYSVRTNVNQVRGCKNVQFLWFRPEYSDKNARPYAELIQNYNSDDEFASYAEGAVDELFTEQEAQALKEYVDREYGDEGQTTIDKVQLPIPNNTIGLGAIPVGGDLRLSFHARLVHPDW